MRRSLHHRRTLVGGFRLIRMDYAILAGIERAVFEVHLLGGERQFITIFTGVETHGVIPAIGLGHAAGEGTGVNQVRQGGGVLVILFVVLLLGADDGSHVTQGVGFGIRAGRIPLKLWLVCGLGR